MTSVDPREIQVECYAGHCGEQEPRRFTWYGRTTEITEVIDAWLAPDHRYFKVRSEDGSIFILRHDPARDLWEMTMFDRRQAREERG